MWGGEHSILSKCHTGCVASLHTHSHTHTHTHTHTLSLSLSLSLSFKSFASSLSITLDRMHAGVERT